MKKPIQSLLSPEEQKDSYLTNAIERVMPPPGNTLFHSQLLELFVHLSVEEEEANLYWEGIVGNLEYLNARLEHHVGLRVAILDYFLNLNKILTSPILVEIHIFKEAEKLALVDGLTGLFNRRAFDVALRKELKRAARYDKDFSILLIDIDNFKAINDTHGHLTGDEVLRKLAQHLSPCIREEDNAYRFGGEEFVLILPETGADGARILAERLRQSLRNDDFLRQYSVTVSGGIASYPLGGANVDMLLANADRALYEAKFSGKDCFVVSTEANQRRRPRFDLNWRVSCSLLHHENEPEKRSEIHMQNVSLGGVRIETEEEYNLGDYILLDLEMPNGAMSIIGKIVWAQPNPTDIHSYGIEFCDLKKHQIRMMTQVLPGDFHAPRDGEVA